VIPLNLGSGHIDRLITNASIMTRADATTYVALALVCLMLGMTASISQNDMQMRELDDVPEKSMTHGAPNIPGSTPGSIFSDTTISNARGTACMVRHNGTLACWGANDAGQLGNGQMEDGNYSEVPVEVIGVTGLTFREVAVGQFAACAITDTNELYCWGGGQFGQLGRPVCVYVGDDYYPCRYAQGKLPAKVHFPGNPNAEVRTIVGSDLSAHFCAIIDDGDVSCWGNNDFGQVGNGDWCSEGVTYSQIPAVGDNCNIYNGITRPQMVEMPENRSAIAVSVGMGNSCAVLDNNSLYCWGRSDTGSMGQGDDYLYKTTLAEDLVDWENQDWLNMTDATNFGEEGKAFMYPCPFGGTHWIEWTGKENNTLTGVTTDGFTHGFWAGSDVDFALQLEPIHVPMPNGTGVLAIDSGFSGHTAVLEDGNVAYWGFGNDDERWNSSPTLNPDLGPDVNRSVISFSQGPEHGCAILDNFEAWCGGMNNNGQLGLGNSTYYEDITPVVGAHEFAAIAAGGSWYSDNSRWNSTGWMAEVQSTCAINTTGGVFCWGSDNYGGLGNGGNGFASFPVEIWVEAGTDGTAMLGDRDPDGDGILGMLDELPWGCPAGYYVIDGSCTGVSEAGHYSPEFSESDWECQPGEFQPLAGQGFCIEASPGHYVSGSTATSQESCESGHYQPDSGQTSCLGADMGHETNNDATAQMMCGTGYYQPLANQSDCLAADPGNYVGSVGSTTQTECAPGTYSANLAASSCSLAFAGHYAPGNGSVAQTPCEPGTYSDELGLGECKVTEPGHYTSGSGSTFQTPCSMPQFQASQGQSECIDSNPGHYVDTDGAISEGACPAGTFQPSYGATECMDTNPGHHAPSEGTGDEVPCPTGQYQPDSGSIVCLTANPGSFVDSEGSSSQMDCGEGHYQPDSGSDSCLTADSGYYADGTGSEVQRECVPGTYQPDSGQASCIEAEAGNSAEGPAASSQVICSPGTYQPEPGRASCIEATAGAFVADEGSLDFEYCEVGTYQPSTGQSECLEAEAGYIVSLIGSLGQYPCEAGTYQPSTGQTECIDAQKGHYVEAEGSPSQTPCEAGTYQQLAKATYCIVAGANHFVPESGAFFQQPCPSGETQPEKGQTSCIAEQSSDSGGSVPGFAFIPAIVAISLAAIGSRRR